MRQTGSYFTRKSTKATSGFIHEPKANVADSLKLSEMQRTNIEYERQRHLANWLKKSEHHMATTNAQHSVAENAGLHTPTSNVVSIAIAPTNLSTQTIQAISRENISDSNGHHNFLQTGNFASHSHVQLHPHTQSHFLGNRHGAHIHSYASKKSHKISVGPHGKFVGNSVFQKLASNRNTSATGVGVGIGGDGCTGGVMDTSSVTSTTNCANPLVHPTEGRKSKLRRFNSHDTCTNMFSVADFEHARLARRNDIELNQRLQRHVRNNYKDDRSDFAAYYNGRLRILSSGLSTSDCSNADARLLKQNNNNRLDALPVEEFLERYSLPCIVRISYKTQFSRMTETLQSSSSNDSSTLTYNSSTNGAIILRNSGETNTNILSVSTSTSSTSSTSTLAVATSTGSLNSGQFLNTGNEMNFASAHSHQTPENAISQTNGNGSDNSNNSGNVKWGHHNKMSRIYYTQDSEHQEEGELFVLYRLVRQRHIYHGHNAKTTSTNCKKAVLIPQEFPGYFSLLNENGLPTATLYTSIMQLVRDRVCKFVSVENMSAFCESQIISQIQGNPSLPVEGCLSIYNTSNGNSAASNSPQYLKTTAKGGQVFKLLAVYEDGKQDQSALSVAISCGGLGSSRQSNGHGREKEKSRYAQLLNEQRQTLYVSLTSKGKFYEVEPGIPQILQKRLDVCRDSHKKVNPDCVHRIATLIAPGKQMPITLRYISGLSGSANAIPDIICINRVSTENVIVACPIEDAEIQSPLHLKKLHLTKDLNLTRNTLGFESEQRMLANPNVQNILKYCQFNCDQFLKMVEIEFLQRNECSGTKSQALQGLKMLKPSHLPRLLKREKTVISAHEKEDSIIFLNKSDLANFEHKEQLFDKNTKRFTDKMKVFQSTKKKWFRWQEKSASNSLTYLDLHEQAKRMSMERYSDMSKLLQERFGDKARNTCQNIFQGQEDYSDIKDQDTEGGERTDLQNCITKHNDNTLQKALSLQNIKLLTGMKKPDLLYSQSGCRMLTDMANRSCNSNDHENNENRDPHVQQSQRQHQQQMFITEKLYNEFHVKTKLYSKSSSSLHQLLNFSLPQKLMITDSSRITSMVQLKDHSAGPSRKSNEKRFYLNVGERISCPTASQATRNDVHLFQHSRSLLSHLSSTSLVDDLPYSSVRDSLILSNNGGNSPQDNSCVGSNKELREAHQIVDYAKDNIYAEICHDTQATYLALSNPSNDQSETNAGIDDSSSGLLNSNRVTNDYGDYASLTYSTSLKHSSLQESESRVEIICPTEIQSTYPWTAARFKEQQQHITTVNVMGDEAMASDGITVNTIDSRRLDNIYNTLK